MPQLGESVAEGTIGKWLKQPGDKVAKYEPLVEVITDKVNAEVPSPFEGILKEILVEEGATVPNNAEIAIIETAEDAASGGTTDAQPAKAAAVSPDDKGAPSTVKAEAIAPAATSEPASPAPRRRAPERDRAAHQSRPRWCGRTPRWPRPTRSDARPRPTRLAWLPYVVPFWSRPVSKGVSEPWMPGTR